MVGAAVRWSAMAGGVGDRFSSEEEGREAAVRDRRGEGKTAEGGGWVGKYVERKAVWEFARGGCGSRSLQFLVIFLLSALSPRAVPCGLPASRGPRKQVQ